VIETTIETVRRCASHRLALLECWLRAQTRPHTGVDAIADRFRSRQQLIAENRLLRQIAKPKLDRPDRVNLVMLAGRTKTWASAMLLVKPDTILRWHREGFRLFWRRKSRPKSREPRVPKATVELIRQMAQNNKLWGAERIRGDLLKLGIRHAKSTIQKYMRAVRQRPPRGQSWTTFLRNHGHRVWACDFLQTYDVLFRPIFAFFIIEIGTRRIVHVPWCTTRDIGS
jgi:putative transposase